MADTTISSLPLGTPSGNISIPYSDGNTTYSARPSAIVAAGVTSGTILQTVYGQDNTVYSFPNPGTTQAPYNKTSTLTFNLKSATSKVLINTSAYCYGFRGTNSNIPGVGLFLQYNDNDIISRSPFAHQYSYYVDYLSASLTILAQHTPGVINPTYRLAIQKPSLAGTGEVGQYSSYWIMQEIAA